MEYPTISIVQIMPMGEHFILLSNDQEGRVCTVEEYEEFLFNIGADLVHRY